MIYQLHGDTESYLSWWVIQLIKTFAVTESGRSYLSSWKPKTESCLKPADFSSPSYAICSRSILMVCFNQCVIYSQEILLQIRLYQELEYQVEHFHDQLPASFQCVQAQSVPHQLSTAPDTCCRAPVCHASTHGQVQLRLLPLGWALPWKHRLWGPSGPPVLHKIQLTFYSGPNCIIKVVALVVMKNTMLFHL